MDKFRMSSICCVCHKDRKVDSCELCDEHCIHDICYEDMRRCNCGLVFGACFYCNMNLPLSQVNFFYSEEPLDIMQEFSDVFNIGVKDAKEGKEPAKFIEFNENDSFRKILAKEYFRGYNCVSSMMKVVGILELLPVIP